MTEANLACIHYWVLETPNGTTSKGTCKLCGTEQDYYNTPEYMREGGNQWMRHKASTWAEKQRQDRLSSNLNT